MWSRRKEVITIERILNLTWRVKEMDQKYQDIVNLLKKELITAMGCTEPIAIAYAAARAREVLAEEVTAIDVKCSGNIIKNVKGVIVPTTKDMRGIETSAILGVVGGNPDQKLEVLQGVVKEHIDKAKALIEAGICKVHLVEGVENLYIKVIVRSIENSAEVTIVDSHTNIIEIKRNQDVIFESKETMHKDENTNSALSFEEIYDFAKNVDIKLIKELMKKQAELNMAISQVGMSVDYGARIGKTIMSRDTMTVMNKAKAYAAAASDARMGGCELPVVINSGSGNQGITASIPVVVYADDINASEEDLYRALALSNLIALYIKNGIGKLSAYCGVVGAACGAVAGIGFLKGDSGEIIETAISNSLGITSGMICDGAKASCAAKIAVALDGAMIGMDMAENKQEFLFGEGIIGQNVDDTIYNIWRLGKDGMKETDIEILKMMLGE